jgi:hypothetical protein
MRTKLHKNKEEERAAIDKEIVAISVDLERLRTIIQRATADSVDQQTAMASETLHESIVAK